MRGPRPARPEWALNETVVEGIRRRPLRLLTDGSLELISPSGKRERRPVDSAAGRPGLRRRLRRHPAPFHRGPALGAAHETRAADNLKTMDVVWAAYRSAEEGRTVAV